MIKINLTEEEKRQLVDETNEMIAELNEISTEIFVLNERLSRIGLYQRLTADKETKFLYSQMELRLTNRSRKYLSILEKINLNKEKLGIKKMKTKKKNKTL